MGVGVRRRCAALDFDPTIRPSGYSMIRSTSAPPRSLKCHRVGRTADREICLLISIATNDSSSAPKSSGEPSKWWALCPVSAAANPR